MDALRRPLPIFITAGIVVFALGALVAGSLFARTCGDCSGRIARLNVGTPVYDEAVTIYDHADSALAAVGGEKRFSVPLEAVPELVQRAWVAVEDRRFRDHSGVDPLGVARAAVANLSAGEIREGASTIPMQVVRIVWAREVDDMGPWERKWFEARMAPRLVDRLGHDGVLELYLNGLYLGEGVYGAAAAARHYYGRELSALSVDQIATLVGLGKTPERYNPRRHPDRARARRDLVLARMLDEGLISSSEYRAALQRPIETIERPPVSYERSWSTAAVRRELRQVAPELVGRPGLRVFTTLDPDVQARADSLLRRHLARVEAGELGARATPDQPVEGAFIALDSRTGAIRAVVGGRSFAESPLNRALQTRRQVGSLAKPLLLATAYEAGFSETHRVSTEPIVLQGDDGPWAPADHVEPGRLLPDEVVIRSSNRGAVRIGHAVGPHRFVDGLRQFGVGRDARPYPSAYLGAFEASLVELSAAYAAFENGGFGVHPHLIRRIEDARGTVLWTRELPAPRRIVRESTAFLVQSTLRGVVDAGTGWRVRQALGPDALAAGKTGTSNDGRDTWFVGSVPGLALGVWVGHDTPAPVTRGGSGSSLAAPLWADVAAGLAADSARVGDGSWTPPATVRAAAVDAAGRVVPADCVSARAGRRVWVARERVAETLSACAPSIPVVRSVGSTRLDTPPLHVRPLELSRASAGNR